MKLLPKNARKKRLAMLDLLIAASRENHITDFDIREEVDTFMFAGHEPTAVGICYLLLLLAEHKDIQDRIRAEVDSVMQEDGERFTLAMLQKLPYLDRCLKESMRLYPSVHFISRLISEDMQIMDYYVFIFRKFGPDRTSFSKLCFSEKKYVVPAGTVVHLNIYGVHRDPNFWPNPEVFDPDRFLPERSQNHHPYSYLPFSAGPRNCLGKFALLQMKAMIAPLLHSFYLEPIDYLKDLKIKSALILRPAHPLRVRFVPTQDT
ncbi:Cytochrome P450 4C1 [Ooceraea biroi]|uniref:Cytochrome P450 4C1 n=1 Tax=Ooceraea biroi TaxID=2015173 RepID=A0A026W7D7_OOCBI|nr:Cytochrome P450 4C1 [Ooceraea biroi]